MYRTRSALLIALGLLLLAAAALRPGVAQTGPGVLRVAVDSAIGPASADYIVKAVERAEAENYALLVVELDTPGGLDSAMRDIIKAMLGSDVPVAIYVSPAGSRAASAGTYMLYASHVAAMHPVSNLGAATPVQIGGTPSMPEFPDRQPADESGAADEGANDSAAEAEPQPDMPADAGKAKMINDAVAYIKGLAELRGRNIDWAEKAVREAVSLTASEALTANVIDVVAKDIPDLLEQIDGRSVDVNGRTVVLQTAGLAITTKEPDWRTNLLMIITDPSVAYLLMLVGIYGLLLEGYNPGALVPGVIGGICLLLALFAFQVLPVNYAGLALMILGVALMVAEGFVPSFGVLGIGGLAAFVFGSVILMDSDIPGFGISVGLIAGVATVGGLAVLGLVFMLMRARIRPIVSGAEGMVGDIAEALEDFDHRGSVFLDGERWTAEIQAGPVRKGDRLRVTAIEGLVARVTRADDLPHQNQ